MQRSFENFLVYINEILNSPILPSNMINNNDSRTPIVWYECDSESDSDLEDEEELKYAKKYKVEDWIIEDFEDVD